MIRLHPIMHTTYSTSQYLLRQLVSRVPRLTLAFCSRDGLYQHNATLQILRIAEFETLRTGRQMPLNSLVRQTHKLSGIIEMFGKDLIKGSILIRNGSFDRSVVVVMKAQRER